MLSQRLRQLRKERSLTLQMVADHLGVTRASASKWETGASHPDFKRLDALAKLYGVTTPELLGSPAPQQHVRSLPVVYLDYGSPIEELLERARKQAGFPTRLSVSDRAFYVALGGYMTANFGLGDVDRQALLLVEPDGRPGHGDLVLARTKSLGYQVLAARATQGAEDASVGVGGEGGTLHFVSLGIKLAHLGALSDAQPIGLVIEAVSTVTLLGFALRQRTFAPA
jgi:transcriptional regulator with XRE-family HTH domain